MGYIKNILKKTPLRPLWWKFLKIPPIKAVRARMKKRHKEKFLNKILPEIYKKGCSEPVDEKKVLFIELRLPEISNSFRLLYDELKQNGEYEIHEHFLRSSFVPQKEYERRCKALMRDMGTAKYVFVNEGSNVVGCIEKRPETVMTQVWHGCGAFKKFGMSTAEKIFGGDREAQMNHPLYKGYNYVTVSSPEVIWAYAEAMNLENWKEVIRPIGVSRTDVFFRDDFIGMAKERFYRFFPQAKGKKVILYAPTFRGRVAKAVTPDCFDLKLFEESLGKEYVVVTKHHPIVKELPEIPQELEGSFAKDATKDLSIEDLLCVSDICISDYSSLIFEYSLFERPMLFFAYDLEDYFDWRGFYYDYDELTPGPICRTNEEMIEYIQHIEESFDRKRVIDFRQKFMSACDGHATQRILELVFGSDPMKSEPEL